MSLQLTALTNPLHLNHHHNHLTLPLLLLPSSTQGDESYCLAAIRVLNSNVFRMVCMQLPNELANGTDINFFKDGKPIELPMRLKDVWNVG